ncbi:MAG TPA: hypothetical protein VIX17_24205 [Pyrinomonadaceae bacterium]
MQSPALESHDKLTQIGHPSTENRTGILRCMATCVVSYVDTSGIRHSVEVEADSMYEAAVLGIKVFRQHDCEPREGNRLEIEVRSSVVHTLTMRKIHDWLNGGAKTPKEAVTKEKLREML